MNIPVSRQLPAPSPQSPGESPRSARPKPMETDEDYAPDRLGAAAGEENDQDDEPPAYYATD
jgi:hypothetical protein